VFLSGEDRMTGSENTDRYLKLMRWARRRYSAGGQLVLSVGARPSRYSLIENAAALRYLDGARDHWGGEQP
jgi:hypothetical protein